MTMYALEMTQKAEPIARAILRDLQKEDVELAAVVVYLLQRFLQTFLDATNVAEAEKIYELIDDIEDHLLVTMKDKKHDN